MKLPIYLRYLAWQWLLVAPATSGPSAHAAESGTIRLTSPKFQHNGAIPTQYTCQGQNISPPLQWSNVPPATKSFVLIVDDPDAPDPAHPKMTWIHWVLYDIPPTVDHLEANIAPKERVTAIGTQGMSDFKKPGYGGPCPPIGLHRYFFKLYALDKLLNLPPLATKSAVEKALEGHVLGSGILIGTYHKGG